MGYWESVDKDQEERNSYFRDLAWLAFKAIFSGNSFEVRKIDENKIGSRIEYMNAVSVMPKVRKLIDTSPVDSELVIRVLNRQNETVKTLSRVTIR
jgi:hypothetical protein